MSGLLKQRVFYSSDFLSLMQWKDKSNGENTCRCRCLRPLWSFYCCGCYLTPVDIISKYQSYMQTCSGVTVNIGQVLKKSSIIHKNQTDFVYNQYPVGVCVWRLTVQSLPLFEELARRVTSSMYTDRGKFSH